MKINLVVLTAATLLSGSLFGQTFTANLTGVVTDQGGAIVPGAAVTLNSQSTSQSRKTTTNLVGRYTFAQLPPAEYSLTVTMSGFREQVHRGVALGANQSVELNVSLEVGAVSETVEVTAAAPLLDTETANESSTLNTSMMQNLPLANRAPLALVTATVAGGTYRAGFMGQGASDDQNVARFNVFGGRENTAQILIDGVPAKSGGWGGLIAEPGADTVQELQVIRNTYEAQYGRSGSGVVNMTTRGGTDHFHGTLFEYFRNDHLNANDFWSNLRGQDKVVSTRNQFGGNFSGPILRSKGLYFLVGYEASRFGNPSTRTASLPTALQRQGDFSQTFNPDGTLQVIYNPASTAPDPNNPGSFIRSPFGGNMIPQDQWDSVGKNYAQLVPQPNSEGDPVTGANNFFGSGNSTFTSYHADFRGDWSPSDSHRVWARVTKARSKSIYSPQYWDSVVESSAPQVHPRYHISAGETWIANPTTVVNVVLGGGRWFEHWPNYSWGFDPTTLGFSDQLASQFDIATSPQVTMSNYATLGFTRELRLGRNNFNAQVNVTKTLNMHNIKFGFSIENQQLNYFDARAADFGFSQIPTAGPDPDSRDGLTGNAFASLLLGAGTDGQASHVAKPAQTDRYYAFYVQDAWKVTNRLTFSYGIRYELQRPRTERYNQMAYFDPNVANPLGADVGMDLQGGLKYVTSSDRNPWDQPWKDFAPRVGLAYRATDKLVIRTGFGISYLRTMAAYLGNPSNDGFSVTTPWVASLDGGRTVENHWANPFPDGISNPPGSRDGLLTYTGLGLNEFVRHRPTPYMMSYSLDLQYRVGNNSVLELGYAGRQGRRLLTPRGFELNQLPDSALTMGNALLENVPNPFYGVITSGSLAAETVQRGQLLRPFPQYTSTNLLLVPGTSSSFDSFNAKFTHRFRAGLTLLASYQLSKSIDNASSDGGDARPLDYNNFSLDRSLSQFDFPHSLLFTFQYEIPVGHGKSFGAGMPSVVDAIVGGWSVSGIYSYTSGLPLNFTTSNNTFSFGGSNQSQRPNISDRSLLAVNDPTRLAWFNKDPFSQPDPFTFGNAPRYVGDVRVDSTNNMDLGVQKTFKVTEAVNLQFRGDAFNAFNRNQFNGPQTNFTSNTFGQVTSSRSTPRNIQLALRLSF